MGCRDRSVEMQKVVKLTEFSVSSHQQSGAQITRHRQVQIGFTNYFHSF